MRDDKGSRWPFRPLLEPVLAASVEIRVHSLVSLPACVNSVSPRNSYVIFCGGFDESGYWVRFPSDAMLAPLPRDCSGHGVTAIRRLFPLGFFIGRLPGPNETRIEPRRLWRAQIGGFISRACTIERVVSGRGIGLDWSWAQCQQGLECGRRRALGLCRGRRAGCGWRPSKSQRNRRMRMAPARPPKIPG